MDLLMWWNLPFILPFVTALVYLLLMSFGLVSAEHGTEHDIDQDFDHDLEHDVGQGVEHTVGHEYETGGFLKALSFLGIGRVPLSIIIMSFFFIWGFSGWASNTLLKDILRFPEVYFWISLFLALAVSIILTRYISLGLSKIMPATETYAVSREQLAGKLAEARYPITENSGTATLRDQREILHEVPCRVKKGEPSIPQGVKVLLLYYDRERKAFEVELSPFGQESQAER